MAAGRCLSESAFPKLPCFAVNAVAEVTWTVLEPLHEEQDTAQQDDGSPENTRDVEGSGDPEVGQRDHDSRGYQRLEVRVGDNELFLGEAIAVLVVDIEQGDAGVVVEGVTDGVAQPGAGFEHLASLPNTARLAKQGRT